MLIGLGVYMALFDRRPMGQARGDFSAGMVYVSNWFQIFSGQSYTAAAAFAPLRHLWSLAVEEQFYLVWPLVMVVILRRRSERLPRVALWLLGVSVFIATVTAALFVSGSVYIGASCTAGESHGYLSVLGRCVNVNEALYLSTFTRAGGLMLGAAFAMVWRPVAIMRGPMRRRGRLIDLVAVVGLAGLAWMMNERFLLDTVNNAYDPWLFRGGFFLVGLCTLATIAAATHRRSWVGRLLGIRPLNWVGTRSYGLYLYHWPIFQILRQPGQQLTVSQFCIAMLITVPVTELSYRLIELPVRKGQMSAWLHGERRPRSVEAAHRRRRAVVVASAVAVLTGFATVSIATAKVLCVGEVECDSATGAQAISSSTTTTTTTTTAPTTAAPGTTLEGQTTLPTTVPPTTVDPIALRPVVAIGESVMLGAAPQLQAGGFSVNAAVSRQGKNVAEVAGLLRASGQLGRIVVIQTGTNGPVSDATFAAIMASLPPDQTPLVVFLTVKAPKGWIADNNTRIRALPTKYPNVKVLDWETAAQQISGELSASDGGIHLSTVHAKQYYANLIFDAIGRPDLKK
jgi:peptidoglycan/LPS O-acetylase OafA/YrhL